MTFSIINLNGGFMSSLTNATTSTASITSTTFPTLSTSTTSSTTLTISPTLSTSTSPIFTTLKTSRTSTMDLSGIESCLDREEEVRNEYDTSQLTKTDGKKVKKLLATTGAVVLAPVALTAVVAGKIAQFIPVFGVPINHCLLLPVEATQCVSKHSFAPFKKFGDWADKTQSKSIDNSLALLFKLEGGTQRKKALDHYVEMQKAQALKELAEFAMQGGDLEAVL